VISPASHNEEVLLRTAHINTRLDSAGFQYFMCFGGAVLAATRTGRNFQQQAKQRVVMPNGHDSNASSSALMLRKAAHIGHICPAHAEPPQKHKDT